jgi:hypothetical protein
MFAVDEFASRTVMRTRTRTRTLRLRKSEEGEERRDRYGGVGRKVRLAAA